MYDSLYTMLSYFPIEVEYQVLDFEDLFETERTSLVLNVKSRDEYS